MFNLPWNIVGGLLAIGLVAGLLVYHLILQWKERQRQRFPNRWQLDARGLLTTQEHQVWHWLKGAFYDHHVLIKTPLSRFTRPRNKHEGKACAHMLASMFSTFTVCTSDGTVVGCVDVPGKKGLLLSHRDTKEAILTSCGIGYAVVRAANLPGLETMRAAFLGEVDLGFADSGGATLDSEAADFQEELQSFAAANSGHAPLAEAKVSLQTRLEFARKERANGFNPLITQTGTLDDSGRRGYTDATLWKDSFLSPLDTRAAPLK